MSAPPPAPRKIRIVAELKPREIDLVLRRFGKVDAGVGHAHVFVGRIAPAFQASLPFAARARKKAWSYVGFLAEGSSPNVVLSAMPGFTAAIGFRENRFS